MSPGWVERVAGARGAERRSACAARVGWTYLIRILEMARAITNRWISEATTRGHRTTTDAPLPMPASPRSTGLRALCEAVDNVWLPRADSC
jgi:hypothetical protein